MSLPRVRKSSVHCTVSTVVGMWQTGISKKRGERRGEVASSLFAIFTPSPPNGRKGEEEASPSPPVREKNLVFPIFSL